LIAGFKKDCIGSKRHCFLHPLDKQDHSIGWRFEGVMHLTEALDTIRQSAEPCLPKKILA